MKNDRFHLICCRGFLQGFCLILKYCHAQATAQKLFTTQALF